MRAFLHRTERGSWSHSLTVKDLPKALSLKRRKEGVSQVTKLCTVLNFMERYLFIVPKDSGEAIRFRLNAVQVILAHVIAWCWALCTPCRMLVPKARQMGVTTFFCAFFFARGIMENNFRSLVVAHVEKSSKEVFSMIHTFNACLEAEIPLNKLSQGLIEWGHGSRIQIAMVGEGHKDKGDALGKGFTINGFHGTEVANWADSADPDLAWASASPALADNGETVCCFESTGKGSDPIFKKTWDEHQERMFTRVFLPWYMDSRYQLTRDDYTAEILSRDLNAEVSFELTREEKELREEIKGLVPGPGDDYCVWPHELTLEQLLWRRVNLAVKCFGKQDLFDRYYPSTWQRAFRNAGDSPFGEDVVRALNAFTRPPELMGYMRGSHFFSRYDSKQKWGIAVWEKPIPGERYVIPGDPSDGVEGGDPSAAYVMRYDRTTGLFVTCARLHGTIDEDTLAYQMVKLGESYNNAKLIPETNRPGVTQAIRDLGYKNVYWQQSPNNPENKKGRAKNPGFYTSKASRKAIFSLLKRLARDNRVRNYCAILVGEVESLVKKGDRWEHKPGSHDDCVVAVAIGLAVLNEIHKVTKTKSPEKKPAPTVLTNGVNAGARAAFERHKRAIRRMSGNTGKGDRKAFNMG